MTASRTKVEDVHLIGDPLRRELAGVASVNDVEDRRDHQPGQVGLPCLVRKPELGRLRHSLMSALTSPMREWGR